MQAKLREVLGADYSYFCVGSLPFKEPQAAIEFLCSYPHIVPFWPELPRRSEHELTVRRAERALQPDWRGYTTEDAAGFFAFVQAVRDRLFSPRVIKGQLCGPLSLLLYSEGLKSAWFERLNDAVRSVVRQVEWQAEQLAGFGAPLLFVFDEPGLMNWSTLTDSEKERLREVYSYLYVMLSEAGHYSGLHSCAELQPDILDFPFDLIHFDALSQPESFFFSEGMTRKWASALTRGVIPLPGTFPAVLSGDEEAALREGISLRGKFEHLFSGLSSLNQAPQIYSATCGHANASAEWLERLYDPVPRTF